jgi:hypothetical protein
MTERKRDKILRKVSKIGEREKEERKKLGQG